LPHGYWHVTRAGDPIKERGTRVLLIFFNMAGSVYIHHQIKPLLFSYPVYTLGYLFGFVLLIGGVLGHGQDKSAYRWRFIKTGEIPDLDGHLAQSLFLCFLPGHCLAISREIQAGKAAVGHGGSQVVQQAPALADMLYQPVQV
jgi:hypothetical protein